MEKGERVKHTRGPWRAESLPWRNGGQRRRIFAGRRVIAWMEGGNGPAAVAAADARLIAAAPTMLEALERARQFIENGVELGYVRMPDSDAPDPAHDTLPAIRAAIAAARGGPSDG